ncbi:MAG: alpha/beta hydrolase, partial [Candidatus Parcubacteria bacterium]|nr:alpha/beta hydrolase [Candidatus Parcubacteria bacterium]
MTKEPIFPEQDKSKIEELKKHLAKIDKWLKVIALIVVAIFLGFYIFDEMDYGSVDMASFFSVTPEAYLNIIENLGMIFGLAAFILIIAVVVLVIQHDRLRVKLGKKPGFDFNFFDYIRFYNTRMAYGDKALTHPRVFIVHGWGGNPSEAWFPWLKKQLEAKGIEVFVPQMPDTEHPVIDRWVSFLAYQIGWPDSKVYLVGHSIGVQTILRYLQTLDRPIGGVVSVAGFYRLIPHSLEGPEEDKLAKPWLETPIDSDKVKQRAQK